MNITLLGCGKLGYGLATCLKEQVGSQSFYLTNKNQHLREAYSVLFPNVWEDNIAATREADLVCLLTRPDQIEPLLDEVQPFFDDTKLILNFTTRRITLPYPLINVACFPISGKRISALSYSPNELVTDNGMEKFTNTFQPVSDHFSRCDDHLEELGKMARVYCHLVAYFRYLAEEKMSEGDLGAYFSAVTNLLSSMGSSGLEEKTRTKGGISEKLFKLHENHLQDLVHEERQIAGDFFSEKNS